MSALRGILNLSVKMLPAMNGRNPALRRIWLIGYRCAFTPMIWGLGIQYLI